MLPVSTLSRQVQNPRCFNTTAERMADAIAELSGAGQPVTEEAMIQRGFTRPVIARFQNEARQIARRRWNKRVA